MNMRKRLASTMAVATVLAPAAELPVRQVVIYKNGVAWVERAGPVAANNPIQLVFAPQEMNDVLKSLVLESRGGSVARARYDGAIPPRDELPLGEEQPLAKLLDRFRGARVVISEQGKETEGRLISGHVSQNEETGLKQDINLLLDNGEIRRINLDGVSAVRLTEPLLQRQLNDTLLAAAQRRSKANRTVTIDAPQATQVTARYLLPFPSWKSSYRLTLPPQGEATLEGWAIVDNASQDDWKGVSLVVVSGRPVSFISRLYDPLFIQRQEAALPGQQAAASAVLHQQALAAAPPPAQAGRKMMALRGAANARDEAMAEAAAAPEPMFAPEVETESREAGELFEYRFSDPVNVGKGESVLLPFVRQKLSARRLLVYTSGSHPRAAAELTNTTGKTLDGGPMTVYEADGYAGEALINTTRQGDKRLVSFAEDTGTTVTRNFDSDNQIVRAVTAKQGIIQTRTAQQITTTYTVSNSDARAKSLLIEHRVNPDLKLIAPKAEETTPDYYRFALALPPNATQKLAVQEEREISSTLSVLSMRPDMIFVSLQNWKLSAAAQKQLRAIADRMTGIAETDRAAQDLEKQINDRVRDQERIRNNMSALSRVANQQEAVQKYAQELARTDGEIGQLQVKLNDARARKAALERELKELAERLEF